MVFAEISNGNCTNVVEAEEAFAQAAGLVEVPEGFGIGDVFDGASWQKQSKFDDQLEALRQENDSLRERLSVIERMLSGEG